MLVSRKTVGIGILSAPFPSMRLDRVRFSGGLEFTQPTCITDCFTGQDLADKSIQRLPMVFRAISKNLPNGFGQGNRDVFHESSVHEIVEFLISGLAARTQILLRRPT